MKDEIQIIDIMQHQKKKKKNIIVKLTLNHINSVFNTFLIRNYMKVEILGSTQASTI